VLLGLETVTGQPFISGANGLQFGRLVTVAQANATALIGSMRCWRLAL
jgi:hypothetical protein